MGIRVVTDSGSDIPQALAKALDISIVSLIVTSGGRSYEDTSLSNEAFWRMARSAEGVKTSQPPIGAFYRVFQSLVDQGHNVICPTITSRHSGTYNAAWVAAQEFGDRVRVVDTLSLSIAQGWQVIQAAELALRGATMEQITTTLESLRQRTRVLIYLDSPEFLRRGGRAASIMPHIERLVKALSLHPILSVVDGELKLFGVVRSPRKAIERIAQQLHALAPIEKLGVMHVQAHESGQQLAAELARRLDHAIETIYVGEAGVVLASHAGAGVVAGMGVEAPR